MQTRQEAMPLSDNARGALYMNMAMLSFTLNDTAMKAAMKTMPLFQAITLRGLVATVLLLAIGARLGALRFRLPRRDLGLLGWRIVFEILATLTFLVALTKMPLANLSAIMQATPLAVALGAALFMNQPIGWRRLVAILIGFVGVMIIVRPGPTGFDIWAMLGLASVLCVVGRDLTTKGMSRAVPSVTVALTASASVLVMGLIGVGVEGWPPVQLTNLAMLAFAGVGLVIGYLTIVATMRVGDIGFVAPFRYTALIWAILLGWLSFGYLPDALTLLGAALVVATGLFTLWRERRVKAARA
jgi:drug/metabolite transporter (DMT)-like permease